MRYLTTALMLACCGCFGSRCPSERFRPIRSPNGLYMLYAPVSWSESAGADVSKVTITDTTGIVLFVDGQSDFIATLSVYFAWDDDDRAWLYSSDDGTVWFYEMRGEAWTKNLWGAGRTRSTARDLMPPPGLFPEYVRYEPDSVLTVLPPDSTWSGQGDGWSVSITYPPIAMEIPEIGDSLGCRARGEADAFLALVGDAGGWREGVGGDVTLSLETAFVHRPSPRGLVCILESGWDYSGGAHGMSWDRSYIYDIEAGAFIEPSSLLGDSADFAAFAAMAADSLRAILGGNGLWIDEGTAPSAENYSALLPLPDAAGSAEPVDSFLVIFQPYQVAPYAYGSQQLVIRRLDEQRGEMHEDGI